MLKQLQFALYSFIATADVRSRQWARVRALRRNPTQETIEEAILSRHRLRFLIEEFLDSNDPRLQHIAVNLLFPMVEDLNRLIPEAEARAEG